MLAFALFSVVKVSENQRNIRVYADTQSIDFMSANFENKEFSRDRSYSEIDFTATVKDFDRRAYVLDQYFLNNNSPLYGTAKYFTAACNKYNAPKDCLVVAAIAMNETHLCKYANSAEMHNCWGFGGPAEHRINFPNFEVSIDRVTDVLANQYGYKYMIDPSLMERTFCGWEPGCTNWGNKIKHFMDQINDLSKSLNMGDLYALRE